MAFLRFEDADAPFFMSDSDVSFSGSTTTSPTQWQFDTGNDGLAIAFGTGMTFDASGGPTGGTIEEFEVRLDGGSNSDAIISGLSVEATAIRTARNFWDVLLAGNDIINTQGLDEQSVGTGISQIFGDVSLASGGIGGNDVFIVGNAATQISGDAWVFGDRFAQLSVKAAPTYQGGNDTIAGVPSTTRQDFYGDVIEIDGAAILLGGKDKMTISSIREGQVYGDVGKVAGRSSDNLAIVNGGDDEIKVLRPVPAWNLVAMSVNSAASRRCAAAMISFSVPPDLIASPAMC